MADPILLLHGYTQSPPVWQGVITALAQRGVGSSYLAPWIPGTGPRDTGFDLDRAVTTLATKIDMEAEGHCDIIGLSLGGIVGMALAARCPELVGRLVVSGGTPRLPRPEAWALRMAVRLLPTAKLPGKLPRRQLINSFRAISALDLRAELPHIACPTLVIVGEQDPGRIPAADYLVSHIPEAELVRLPGGHSLNREEPHRFADAVAHFLRTQEVDPDEESPRRP